MVDVSVVIPTRDRPGLARRAVHCATAQADVDVEVIVIDDGSVTPFALDPAGRGRLRVVRHGEALGVSAARNRGIAEAHARWVAFLDDDDVWAPTKLRSQLGELRRTGNRWGCGGMVTLDAALHLVMGEPPPTGEEVIERLPYRNVVAGGASGVIAEADLLDATGGFSSDLRHLADWDLWLRLADAGAPAVVSEPVVGYVLHGTGASLDSGSIAKEIEILERRSAGRRAGRPIDRSVVHRWAGTSALRAGRRLEAMAHYARAARAGDVAALGRALLAPVAPLRLLARRRVPDEWASAAEAWLAPLRADLTASGAVLP